MRPGISALLMLVSSMIVAVNAVPLWAGPSAS